MASHALTGALGVSALRAALLTAWRGPLRASHPALFRWAGSRHPFFPLTNPLLRIFRVRFFESLCAAPQIPFWVLFSGLIVLCATMTMRTAPYPARFSRRRLGAHSLPGPCADEPWRMEKGCGAGATIRRFCKRTQVVLVLWHASSTLRHAGFELPLNT